MSAKLKEKLWKLFELGLKWFPELPTEPDDTWQFYEEIVEQNRCSTFVIREDQSTFEWSCTEHMPLVGFDFNLINPIVRGG